MTTTISEPPARPAALDFGLELPRTVAEYALFMAAEPLLQRAPAGDGHHVLVLPGFLAVESVTGKPPGYLSSDDASPESEP